MLDRHLEILLHSSAYSAMFWANLTKSEKQFYYRIWNEIEQSTQITQDELVRLHNDSHEKSKSQFFAIPDTPFKYSMIRNDWIKVVKSEPLKKRLFESSQNTLLDFIGQQNIENISMYGGIKSDDSIRRKMHQCGIGRSIDRAVLDLWDIVRFKIILDDMRALKKVSKMLWEKFNSSIARCRNYYYSPRNGNISDPYRAVHFELSDNIGNIIELQLATKYREAISFLDHPFSFKNYIKFENDIHEIWLRDISMKANIIESFQLKA